MLLKPKGTRKEDFENKVLIEKWMKRNSSGSVTIGQDMPMLNNPAKKFKLSTNDVPSNDIEINVSKIIKIGKDVETLKPTTPTKSNNQNIIAKQLPDILSGPSEINVAKLKTRHSLPLKSTELKSPKKSISVALIGRHSDPNLQTKTVDSEVLKTLIYSRKSDSNAAIKKIVSPVTKNLTYTLECAKNSAIMAANRKINSESTEKQCIINKPISPVKIVNRKIVSEGTEKQISMGKTVSPVTIANRKFINQSNDKQCNLGKAISPIKTASKNVENDLNNKNSITSLLGKDKDEDVYTNLLENYRYLITPKSWSVTEFMNENKNRYIVFFNTHVVKENNTLISVMRKSLIIDKGASMNYSVHGLPVNIQGTILPGILDNTKKLLSILHIFDKMQVCQGLGNDLNLSQTDSIFKDNCRVWRHKDCKIVLIKVTQCPVCIETRNRILEKKISNKDSLDLEVLGVKRRKEGKF